MVKPSPGRPTLSPRPPIGCGRILRLLRANALADTSIKLKSNAKIGSH